MPFRERAKNLFKTKSRGDSLTKTNTNSSVDHYADRDRYPSNVYRPDEPMPRPKYRLPPKKEHKEKLEAFNFADAWRRRSFQSAYSPMGTRAPSRRNSFLSRKSLASRSRANSITSSTADKDDDQSDVHDPYPQPHQLRQRETGGGGLLQVPPPMMPSQPEQEGDDDDDVANGASPPTALSTSSSSSSTSTAADTSGSDRGTISTAASSARSRADTVMHTSVGVSRVQSREKATKLGGHALSKRDSSRRDLPPDVTAHDHQPFSEEDLSLALQRSNLTITAR